MKQVFSISSRAALFIILRKSYDNFSKVNPDRKWSKNWTVHDSFKNTWNDVDFFPGSIKGLIYH